MGAYGFRAGPPDPRGLWAEIKDALVVGCVLATGAATLLFIAHLIAH